MKSDIEIAQSVTPLKITEVAEKIGLSEDDLELYGKYKAKISDEALKKLEDKPDGKLVLVTAINPTPGRRGKDHDFNWSCRSFWQAWKEGLPRTS